MGNGPGGGYAAEHASLAANLAALAKRYPITKSGKFGVIGKGNSRVIYSENPADTAKEFFETLSSGASVTALGNGKGWMSTFSDRSNVVYRPSSKSSSPVVSYTLGNNSSPSKIHFEPISKGDNQ